MLKIYCINMNWLEMIVVISTSKERAFEVMLSNFTVGPGDFGRVEEYEITDGLELANYGDA